MNYQNEEIINIMNNKESTDKTKESKYQQKLKLRRRLSRKHGFNNRVLTWAELTQLGEKNPNS
jgi:hypothetical protein